MDFDCVISFLLVYLSGEEEKNFKERVKSPLLMLMLLLLLSSLLSVMLF